MTILLVNHDRNQQETFCEILRRIDPTYKCLKRFSTESALEFLRDPDCVSPDLIFLDLAFPANDGKQMLRELKRSADLKHIPVCIYTESVELSDRDETRKMGAIGYIIKEQNLGSLSESIISVIASCTD
jgi:DNA-binding response OmpR family regulator